MKKLLYGSGAGVAAAALVFAGMPASAAPEAQLAPLTMHPEAQAANADGNSFIVNLKPGVSGTETARELGVSPKHVYQTALNGFSATLSPEQMQKVRQSDKVQGVSQSFRIQVAAPPKPGEVGSWGLDRIDQPQLPLDNQYTPAGTGAGVTAYDIDTGIDASHPEFEGRASVGFDATGGDGHDAQGHGTHTAGTVGSKSFGVAKQAKLVGVKVLGDDGSGSTADIIKGMDWVAQNKQGPSVANMSLGGSKDPSLDEAATKLVNSGVFLSVAAGNESQDAGNTSPASAEGVFTVAASGQQDKSAQFTNFGQTVEGYAPGEGITSTVPGGGTEAMDGTSMAAPHVTGAGALFLEGNQGAAPADVVKGLQDSAAKGVVQGAPQGTIGDLLQVGKG